MAVLFVFLLNIVTKPKNTSIESVRLKDLTNIFLKIRMKNDQVKLLVYWFGQSNLFIDKINLNIIVQY